MSIRIAPPAKGISARKEVREIRVPVSIRRSEVVEIRVRGRPERIDVSAKMVEDRFDQTDRLYEFWETKFLQVFGIAYVPRSKPAELGLLDDIFDEIGDCGKIEKMMTLLLTHDDLKWVTHKTLTWLAKPRNRTFIAPLMVRRTRTAEYEGSRTPTQKITFRGS